MENSSPDHPAIICRWVASAKTAGMGVARGKYGWSSVFVSFMKTPIEVTDSASRFAPTKVSQVFPLRSGKLVALVFAGAPDIARGEAIAARARSYLYRSA